VTMLRNGRPGNAGFTPIRVQFFLLSVSPTPDLEATQAPIEWLPRALTAELKQSGSEADRLLLSSVGVKNLSSYN
jgi:hypothetical protein